MLPNINAVRLLLVEEDITTAEQLVALLQSRGYVVENAYNVGDALSAVHDRYRLAIVNATMRGRDGRGVLEAIREHPSFSQLPVMILYGATGAELLERVAALVAGRREGNIQQVLAASTAQVPAATVKSTTQTNRATLEMPSVDDEPTVRARVELDAQSQQQLAAFRTLSLLGRSISSVLDINQVLNQIVDAATSLTAAAESMLLLPDDEDKALYIRARKNIDDGTASNFRIPNENTLIGNVYRTGEPVLTSERGQVRLKTQYFVSSALYVPMRYKGKVIGVLGVNDKRHGGAFTLSDQELLLDLAAHAATAIENARLYEDRRQRTRQLETIIEAGKLVNSTLELPDVLLTLCSQIIGALGVSACLIKQRESTASTTEQPAPGLNKTAVLAENELRPLTYAWQTVWTLDRGPRVMLKDRPRLRQAIAQNASHLAAIDPTLIAQDAEARLLRAAGAQEMVALSLRGGDGAPFGLLELYYRQPIPSATADLRSRIRTLAVQITAALSAKKYSRPPAEVLGRAQQILDSTQANWLVISIITGEDQLTRLVQYGRAVFLDEPFPQEVAMPPQTWAVFQEQKPVAFHMRQPDLPPPLREMMAGYGAEAILCLPLSVRGKVSGLFTIYDALEARTFRAEEVSLATALISQAATAIENARLYRELAKSMENLKQTQTSLVQTARLSTMGQLAAVVAHQINNPLTTVITDSEIMLHDLPVDSQHRPAIEAIHRSGLRAGTVVKRLLSTARRAHEDKPQWVDVHETIQNTLDLVSTHVERGGVRLTTDLDRSVASFVQAMPGHLEDVWLNLLLNARDALQGTANAALSVVSRRYSLTLDVMVIDNGMGIPLEMRDKIFEPFYTTKQIGEGTGLGLYICKQVVERCGGKITVDSAPGQGTNFRITLPVQESF